MAEFIRTGALQMAIVPCSVPEGYDADFAIVGAPYLYDNIDHLEKATLNGVFDDLFASTEKYKFRVLIQQAREMYMQRNRSILQTILKV